MHPQPFPMDRGGGHDPLTVDGRRRASPGHSPLALAKASSHDATSVAFGAGPSADERCHDLHHHSWALHRPIPTTRTLNDNPSLPRSQ